MRSSQRAEALARRFEAARDEFLAFAEGLTSEQWRQIVPEEERTVAAMVHHIAWAYETESDIFRAMAEGVSYAPLTEAGLNQSNYINGEIFENADYAETLALLRTTGEQAAAFIRGLTDEQLDRHGVFMENDPEGGTVAEWIEWVLIGHIGVHFPAIRAAAAAVPIGR